jgi:hypothetical protein
MTVEVSTFEDWEPSGRTFEVVVSATAWHWIDRHIGPAKAAEVLPSRRTLTPFWNTRNHPPEIVEAIRTRPVLMGRFAGAKRSDFSQDQILSKR